MYSFNGLTEKNTNANVQSYVQMFSFIKENKEAPGLLGLVQLL